MWVICEDINILPGSCSVNIVILTGVSTIWDVWWLRYTLWLPSLGLLLVTQKMFFGLGNVTIEHNWLAMAKWRTNMQVDSCPISFIGFLLFPYSKQTDSSESELRIRLWYGYAYLTGATVIENTGKNNLYFKVLFVATFVCERHK